jgi:hypothetical protein
MSLSSLYPTISPSLLLDFANSGVLDPRVTFTRPTGGTYFGPDGVLRTAQANAPRFDYNPSTLAAQGLLIEEQRTNLLLYSTEFDNAWWTANGTTVVTPNAGVAPDGTTTAELVTGATGNLTDSLQRSTNIAISNATAYTLTAYIKLGTATDVGIRVRCPGGSATDIGYFASGQDVGNGWRRVTANITSDTTAALVYFGLADGTFYIWGAQLEAGAFPTSYIPTTTTALTRAADAANVNTLSPWFNASEGTLYVETTRGYTGNFVNFPHTGGLSDGTNSNVIWAGYGIAGNQGITPDIASGGVDQLDFVSAAYTMPTAKAAIAYKTNDSQWFFRGTAFAADTTCTMPSGINRLNIGSENTTTQPWNGWIRRVMYYPRRLSQAEGIAITA